MSEPFVGEIKAVAYNFAPKRWSACNGQAMPLSTNQALYSLLGVQFGGNGQTNFNLPDLRGRTPVGIGNSPSLNITYTQGMAGGMDFVSLNQTQIPAHNHGFSATSQGGSSPNLVGNTPQNATLATASVNYYTSGMPDTALIAESVVPAGGGQPHINTQPSLALMYIIALSGIYPSRN